MDLSIRQIESFHKKAADGIEQCIGYRPRIVSQPSDDRWKLVSIGSLAIFQGVEPDAYTDTVKRERGGNCPVFPIKDIDSFHRAQVDVINTAWADWREEWRRINAKKFTLHTASWTFYWGSSGHPNKRQLFRANWDDAGAINAPQPHWHFDESVITEVSISRPMPLQNDASSDLIELTSVTNDQAQSYYQELQLSTLHLGMALQHTGSHPMCWRNSLGNDDSILLKWMELTLRHALEEFNRLDVAPPV